MTTGRINQVTILSQAPKRAGKPPNGSELYQAGSRRNDSNQRPKSAKDADRAGDYSIAPTEAFQDVVHGGNARPFSRSIVAAYTSMEEKTYTATRAFTRKLGKTIP